LKIWIDLSTPKETLLFNEFIKEFKSRGHEIFLTTRKYAETNSIIKYLGLDAEMVGAHGITREEKMKCAADRLKKLYPIILEQKPDALITFTNPEACRIAFGLGIPIFNFTDMPESDKVMRLTLPLSTIVFSPFVVTKELIWKYWDGPTIFYNCLDPIAWMRAIPKPLSVILPELNVVRPFIIYRSGETKAAYYEGKDDISVPIVAKLKTLYSSGTFYEVPRYTTHDMVDMQSLLAHADLFISGGATMAIEAAWWGTWTIACRPVIATYDKWLEENGLQFRANTVDEGITLATDFLSKNGKNPNLGLLWKQSFPLKAICDKIEEKVAETLNTNTETVV